MPGDSVEIDVFGPVTGKTYTLACVRAGDSVTCRGGNAAVVRFVRIRFRANCFSASVITFGRPSSQVRLQFGILEHVHRGDAAIAQWVPDNVELNDVDLADDDMSDPLPGPRTTAAF